MVLLVLVSHACFWIVLKLCDCVFSVWLVEIAFCLWLFLVYFWIGWCCWTTSLVASCCLLYFMLFMLFSTICWFSTSNCPHRRWMKWVKQPLGPTAHWYVGGLGGGERWPSPQQPRATRWIPVMGPRLIGQASVGATHSPTWFFKDLWPCFGKSCRFLCNDKVGYSTIQTSPK